MKRDRYKFDPASQCVGKIPHASYLVATMAVKKTKGAQGTEPYKCPHCFKWHTGHPPGRVMKLRFQGVRRTRGKPR